MEHKAPYALVGLFICIVLAGFVGFIVWIEGGNDKNYKHYTVYFEDSVSGLEEGAEVSYKGVSIGKVDALRLSLDKDDIVKVDVRVRQDVPVHATTVGQLSMTGVTGLTHLDLLPARKNDKEAPLTVEGEPYPVIEGKPSELSKAMKDVPIITQEMRAFSGKLNTNMDKFEGSFLGRMMGVGDNEEERN